MDNPARYAGGGSIFRGRASSKITDESEKLVEVGGQLEFGDDLERCWCARAKAFKLGMSPGEPITKLRYASSARTLS